MEKSEADSNSEETADKLRGVALKAMMANREKKKTFGTKDSAGPSNELQQKLNNTEQSRFEQKEEDANELFKADKGNFNAGKEDERLLSERKEKQTKKRSAEGETFKENQQKDDEMCIE